MGAEAAAGGVAVWGAWPRDEGGMHTRDWGAGGHRGCSAGHRSGGGLDGVVPRGYDNLAANPIVLGKFGPGPIGTRSGPDQTLRSQSRSWSGIFPETWDRLVSRLGSPRLSETVSDSVWTRTA